jgi:hypothetical protein
MPSAQKDREMLSHNLISSAGMIATGTHNNDLTCLDCHVSDHARTIAAASPSKTHAKENISI